MRKIISTILTVAMLMSLLMLGTSLSVVATDNPVDELPDEPAETAADEQYSEFSEYSEGEAEPTDENVPIAAASADDHVLDLSNPPTVTGGVWEVLTLTAAPFNTIVSYTGTGPLTIRGSNDVTSHFQIRVTAATHIIFENNTNFYGTIFGSAPNVTIHGLGNNINLRWSTVWDYILVSFPGNITLTGSFGNLSSWGNSIRSWNGDINISASIESITEFTGPPGPLGLPRVHADGNIYINNTITVFGSGGAFNKQPVITLPHSATWSNNPDGSDATSGSPYIWSEDHKWVRIEILDTPITATDPGTGIGFIAAPGAVPYGTTLQVDRITEGEGFTMITNALAQTSNNFVAFDIKLLSGGVEIQPNGNVTITIPRALWQDYAINRLAVYHIAPDGALTRIPHRMGEGNESIIFDTDRFSFFAVVELPYVPGESDDNNYAQVLGESDVPQTGDTASILFWTALLSLSVLGIALVMVWHRKRVHNK